MFSDRARSQTQTGTQDSILFLKMHLVGFNDGVVPDGLVDRVVRRPIAGAVRWVRQYLQFRECTGRKAPSL